VLSNRTDRLLCVCVCMCVCVCVCVRNHVGQNNTMMLLLFCFIIIIIISSIIIIEINERTSNKESALFITSTQYKIRTHITHITHITHG